MRLDLSTQHPLTTVTTQHPMVKKHNLRRTLDSIREKVVGYPEQPLSNGSDQTEATRSGIAQWARLATSQTNQWMMAVRLHESGNYNDAWLHYLMDANQSRRAGDYGRASLSFALAADCLALIDRTSLAAEFVNLARRCYNRQTLTSRRLEEAIMIEKLPFADQKIPR